MRTVFMLAMTATALAHPNQPLEAQSRALSFDVRGAYSLPIGDFGETAESEFGFGFGGVLSLTPNVGIYGGWARDVFGCDALLCDDVQIRASGFEVGAKFLLPSESRILPWLKAGLIGHTVSFEDSDFESDRKYGFQAAAGLDFPLGEVLSVSPGLRLNLLDVDDDGFLEDPEVRYLSFDLGAHIHIPRN